MAVDHRAFHKAGHPGSTNRQSLYILFHAIVQARGIQVFHRMLFISFIDHKSEHTISLVRLRHIEFTQSEIAESNMSCEIEHDVLWFQVSNFGCQ